MKKSKLCALCVLLLVTFGPMGAMAESMGVGDRANPMTFTDIDGHSASTGDYNDWVQVWTFGNRKSCDRLTDWMRSSGIRAVTKRPELRFAFLNFADVSVVPALFQPMTLAIMRHINEGAKDDLREAYEKQGVELTPERARVHLTADWDGDFLKTLGIPDAEQYHCWIVHGGRVVAHLVEGTPDFASRFAEAIASLSPPSPAAKQP